jgi:hypothetical protein
VDDLRVLVQRVLEDPPRGPTPTHELRRRARRRRRARLAFAATASLGIIAVAAIAISAAHGKRSTHVVVVAPSTTPTTTSSTPTTTSYRGPWLVPPKEVPKATGPLPPPSAPTVLPPSDATLATAQKALSLLPAGFKITDTRDLMFADGTRNARVGFTAPDRKGTLGLFWVQLSGPEPMSPFGLGPGPVTYHRTPNGELVTVDGSQHRSAVFVTPTGLEYVAQYMTATVGPQTTQTSMPIAELARFLTTLASSP